MDVVLDVDAFFTANNGAGLVPLANPVRFVDTRGGDVLYAGGAFGGGETRSWKLAGVSFGGATIPETATVVVATVTAVQYVSFGVYLFVLALNICMYVRTIALPKKKTTTDS